MPPRHRGAICQNAGGVASGWVNGAKHREVGDEKEARGFLLGLIALRRNGLLEDGMRSYVS